MNNIINELFNAPVPWEWNITNKRGGSATFIIDNNIYTFVALKLSPALGYGANAWKIDFSNESVELDKSHGITGTGNSTIVFSTIVDIINDFKKIYSPKAVLFTAAESNRKSLYKRIAKTVFPEFEIFDEDSYIMAKKKNNISESEINRADVRAILQGASDLRANPSFARKITGLKKDKIDVNDLQQIWKDEGFPDDTRDIYAILKSQGFADKEIDKVFSQVFGKDDNDEDEYVEPKATPAIQKIVDYAKKTGITDDLIKFMQNEFGEELGLTDEPGIMNKAWNAGKKLYKKAVAEEVRQIFTAIIQEERIDRIENIKQIQQTQLGRTKK